MSVYIGEKTGLEKLPISCNKCVFFKRGGYFSTPTQYCRLSNKYIKKENTKISKERAKFCQLFEVND